MMDWFDTHFHVDEEDNPQEILQNARAQDVTRFLIQGTSLEDCPRTKQLADPQNGVYVALGMHPHAAETFTTDQPFRDWIAETPGTLAVGEIGLDYFYDFAPRDSQIRVFETFFNLAQELKLPAIIHCRNAFQDCYDIVKANLQPHGRFIIHSFADTPKEASLWLELGARLSVNGMVTFKRADNIRESLAHIPMDRLLLETDSPYLAPVPNRGKRNTPAYLPLVGAKVAEEKCLTVQEVAAITTRNALEFFGLQ